MTFPKLNDKTKVITKWCSHCNDYKRAKEDIWWYKHTTQKFIDEKGKWDWHIILICLTCGKGL